MSGRFSYKSFKNSDARKVVTSGSRARPKVTAPARQKRKDTPRLRIEKEVDDEYMETGDDDGDASSSSREDREDREEGTQTGIDADDEEEEEDRLKRLRDSVRTQQNLQGEGEGDGNVPTGTSVFVRNLPTNISAIQLIMDVFSEEGDISSAVVHTDPDGNSIGTAELTFETKEDAQRAIKYHNGHKIHGRTIKMCLLANEVKIIPKPKPPRARTPNVDNSLRGSGMARKAASFTVTDKAQGFNRQQKRKKRPLRPKPAGGVLEALQAVASQAGVRLGGKVVAGKAGGGGGRGRGKGISGRSKVTRSGRQIQLQGVTGAKRAEKTVVTRGSKVVVLNKGRTQGRRRSLRLRKT